MFDISSSVDVERHARDFMEAAKKLQLYFIGLQREDQPTRAETLQKVMYSLKLSLLSLMLIASYLFQEIGMMEEELKVMSEVIKKQERLIEGWTTELKEQLHKHNVELERV